MSFSETIFLFFLALIIFGPKKLPEIARQAGKLLNEFRRASNEFKSQIEQEIAHLEVENKPTILPPSAPPEGTTSRALSAAPGETSPTAPSTEAPANEAPVAAVASDDEPLFAMAPTEPAPAASDAVPGSEPVTSSSSSQQESHA